MNSSRLLNKALLHCLVLVLFTSHLVQAASVDALQQRTVSLQQHIKEAEQELQSLKQELAELKQEEPAIVREYQGVSEELEKAFAKANSEDEAAHKDAMVVSFKFNRIDRKHTRFFERKKEVEDSVTGMTDKVAEWKAELATAKKDLVEAKVAAEQAQRQAAEKARRKAELKAAEEKKTERAISAAVAVVKQKQPKKTMAVTPAGWPDTKAPKSEQISFAKQEMSRLKALPPGRGPLDRVELEPACGDDVRLEYLGDSLYTATAELSGGMCKLEVFRSDYWVELPVRPSAEYRIIYDVTSISSPKLFVFEERVLR